jgi:LPXTG-motif cell wall-anchored protein
VVVTGPGGGSTPAEFTYVAGTEVTTLDPPAGPEAGGNTVTITGTCFTGATAVRFGDTPATSFTVVSDTEITAVAPAGTGAVGITVVGAESCGTETVPGAYTFTDAPVILTLTPSAGPEPGGTVVTITGVNLNGVTAVTFGGVPGTGLIVRGDTELSVVAPAHAPGAVAVVAARGTTTSAPATFTYQPVATITGVEPSSGYTLGGTSVLITGRCFTGATQVRFGTTPSPSFQILSDTEIRAVAPAVPTPGRVPVTVVGGGTCGTASLPAAFSYVSPTGTSGTSPPQSGPLARTGSEPATVLVLAGMLVAGGAVLVGLRRRLAR